MLAPVAVTEITGCPTDRHIVSHARARRLDHPGSGTVDIRTPCVRCPCWRVDTYAVRTGAFLRRAWILPPASRGTVLHVAGA